MKLQFNMISNQNDTKSAAKVLLLFQFTKLFAKKM